MSLPQSGPTGPASKSASNTLQGANPAEPYLKIQQQFPSSLTTGDEYIPKLFGRWKWYADKLVPVPAWDLHGVSATGSFYDVENNAPELTGEFRGNVGVRVLLLPGGSPLPPKVGQGHVNVTLGIRDKELTPDLARCIDHLPTSIAIDRFRVKRYPHVSWALPSADGNRIPDIVYVEFEALGGDANGGDDDFPTPVWIHITYGGIKKVDLHPASSPFHEADYLEEYNKVLGVLRDFGEPTSRKRKDNITVTFLFTPLNYTQAAEFDRFKSRCDEIFAAEKARGKELWASVSKSIRAKQLAESAPKSSLVGDNV